MRTLGKGLVRLKSLVKWLLFLPMQLAAAYVQVLTLIRSEWANSWDDQFLERVQDKSTEIEHGTARLVLMTPNAVCRFRAETFSNKEPETLEWIDEFGAAGPLFDVGANVGLYSLYYARTQKGNVYAFEPSSLNLGLLTRNINANDLTDRIIVLPLALTDRNKLAKFTLSDLAEGEALSTFGEHFGHDGKPLSAAMQYNTLGMSLDYLISSRILPETPALLKVDVDGIEHIILRGARETLSDPALVSVLIEVNDEFAQLSVEVASALSAAGFTLREKRQSEMFLQGSFASSYNQVWTRE